MTSVALLVDQLYAPAPGGMGTYVRELVPAMLEADPSLEVRPFRSKMADDLPDAPAPWLRTRPPLVLDQDIRRLYPAWALLRRPRLPGALGRSELLHSPVPAAVPPPGRGQRLVVTVHDVAFLLFPHAFPVAWRTMYRAGLRRAVHGAAAIIAPSRHTAEDLIRRTKVPVHRVHVVPLAPAPLSTGQDVEETLARLKVHPPYLLFVGTLEPRKNLVRLVRAYRRVAAAGLPHRLVLAGPIGWQHQALLRELALEGPGEVVMVGRLEDSDLDAVYRGAEAFVYPSLYEGFGLPVLEAMARGVPCVVSTSSSLPEVAGEAALPVDPWSEAGLADSIERVITDRALAERLGQAGLARAARFTWDEAARLTLEVYKSVL